MKRHILYFSMLLIVANVKAQIVNEGVLKIKDGTTVYFGETYTNKAGATHDNEGNLHLNGDLVNNGTMAQSADANTANGKTIFDSPTNASATVNTIQHISGTNKVVVENLELNMTDASSKGVLVADNTELTVEKGVFLISGDLRLENKAQLIQLHTGANSNSGNGKLLKDQQGTTDIYNYNYWSSPVSGTTANQYQVGEVLYDGTDANLQPFSPQLISYLGGSNLDGTPPITDVSGNVTTPTGLASYWIWKFENQTIDDGNGWVLLRDNTAINAGIGYTHKGNGAAGSEQNYVFKGKPNDGTYNLTIGAGKSTLLGNPYPSALDGNQFITDNAALLADVTVPSATTGALYFWEHWGGGSHYQNLYQGGYATYTMAGGTPATSHPLVSGGGSSSGILGQRYIPVGQGFFVESVNGGTITINNAQRLFKVEGADSHFFRNSNPNNDKTVDTTPRIRLGYNNPNGFYRQIMTAFITITHDRHDTGYDARMADVNPDDMFWETNNDAYVIDARPFGIEKQIPIGIKVTNSGIHKIFLDATENFSGPIYILDTNTGYTTDIRQQDFEVQLETGTYLNRFKLVFQPQSPLSLSDEVMADIQVYFSAESDNVVIKNPKGKTLKSITIFNAIGQQIKVLKENELQEATTQIPFKVANGAYIINVQTNKGSAGYKIIAY